VARIALFPGLNPKWAKRLLSSKTRRRAAHKFIAPPIGHVCVCVCAKVTADPEVLPPQLKQTGIFLPQPNPKDFNCANFCAGEKLSMQLFGVCVLRSAFYDDKKIGLCKF
jgi:hypothetical protein